MSIRNILLLSFTMLGSTCHNEGRTSTETKNDSAGNNSVSTINIDSLPSGCYSQIVARDTSFLQLENKDSSINGALTYNIFQKDRNDGTLQAEVSADILKGWYLFKAEGIISVREVAWKIKDNELWPGSGEVIQKNDTMFFSAPDKLQYDSIHPFKKVACII